ncbi:MAG: hypothetical protein V1835_04265, partial [Candidatus Micrarchaeota archaeon]
MDMADRRVFSVDSFKPAALAKVIGALGFIYGLVLGIFVYFGYHASAFKWMPGIADFGEISIFALPVMFGLGGALSGMIFSIAYNMVADLIGGIEFES